MFSQAQFPHRHNPDGGIDSICTACFATVATSFDESKLLVIESAHICDPASLYWMTRAKGCGLL